jgi:3-dehydroquinate dehydratase-2
MKRKLVVIHGPNLNLLGTREVEIYGKLTLVQINKRLKSFARANRMELRLFQSNHEGAIIDCIHKSRKWADGIVINPAAYTHYSIAIRDAIAAVGIPTVEVHLSDIAKRELFRRNSVIKAVCVKQISGLGWKSYLEGIQFLNKTLSDSSAR